MSVIIVADVAVSLYTGQGIAEIDVRKPNCEYAENYLVHFPLDLSLDAELFKNHVEQHIRTERDSRALDPIRGLTWKSVSFE